MCIHGICFSIGDPDKSTIVGGDNTNRAAPNNYAGDFGTPSPKLSDTSVDNSESAIWSATYFAHDMVA